MKRRIKDAHKIDNRNRIRMTCACDSCAEAFNVDYETLRKDGELEVKCPACKRKMLVQYVEYASVMVIE